MCRDITLLRQQVDLLNARHSEPEGLYPQPPLMPPSVVRLVPCTQPLLTGGPIMASSGSGVAICPTVVNVSLPESPHYWLLRRLDRVIERKDVRRPRRKCRDQRKHAPVLTHRANQVDVSLGRFTKGRTPPSLRARQVAPGPWVEVGRPSLEEKEESVRRFERYSKEGRTLVPP